MKTYGSKASEFSACNHSGCECGATIRRGIHNAFVKVAKRRARAEGRKAASVDAE